MPHGIVVVGLHIGRDHAQAKTVVSGLIEGMGLEPFDAGLHRRYRRTLRDSRLAHFAGFFPNQPGDEIAGQAATQFFDQLSSP